MANEGYALWFAELKSPTPEDRRADRSTDPKLLSGFWKILGARTKIDWPLSIWSDQGQDATIFQIGRRVMNTVDHQTEWQEFASQSWLNTVAVTQAEWDKALSTGWWSDGKVARAMSAEERSGMELPSGGNAPPLDESLADQIEAAASTAKALEVTDQTSADKATGILDKLRLLIRKAEAERVTEKAPILEEGKRIDDRWATIKAPGLESGEALEKRRKAWLKKEQDRLDAIAAAETKRRQDEARAEAQRIADEENARRALEAEELGQVPAETVKAEEIEVPIVPVEAPRAKAGTAFGRASGLKKGRVGVITDKAKFIAAISGFPDFTEFLDAKVAKLAKANVLLDGMTIREELQ